MPPPAAHSGTSVPLPPVLVSAAQYSVGLSKELWRDSLARLNALESGVQVSVPVNTEAAPSKPVSMDEVCDALVASAHNHNLPVRFFMRLIWQESGFDPHAVSPVGAQGVAQFMPATADEMGLDDPFDPIPALQASARLLDNLIAQFGNLGLAAAAYNAGPKRVVEWLKRRANLPQETRKYVLSITGHPPDRWRHTELGTLAIQVPKSAPCPAVADAAPVVEVPTPEPPPLPRPRTLVAAGADKQRGPTRVAHHRMQMIINVAAAHRRTDKRKQSHVAHAATHRPAAPARQAKSQKAARGGRRMQMAMGSSVTR